MEPPPPPPPPHGPPPQTGPRTGGLPDGKYDIFVIPPSSAGSGFLYLPSLQTQRNSFLAGVVCTAAAFAIYQTMVPVAKEWFQNTVNGGGSGVVMLMVGVGVISWALGKTQGEGTTPHPGRASSSGSHGAHGQSHSGQSTGAGYAGAPPPQQAPPQPPPPPPPQPPPQSPPPQPPPNEPPPQASPPPKSSWQRPQPNTKSTPDGKSSWDKAREETRKREEQKRREEEIRRRRDELEKERLRQREKETRERLERELKEKRERELKELMAKREKEEKERKEREEREKREKEQKERLERLEKERKEREEAANASARKPPGPTARTEREDDAYSFRPYDRPRKSGKAGSAESIYSEESYAPSATTAKTTPPPSVRGPYSTKDPDKIIIKAVYSFNNAFLRTPIAQLISGQGNVTDGLILRITTEGLFIDDDVRGVPQREWDVKAWTMKLAESCELSGMHVLRASIRDQEGKRYVFILSQSEGWKVAVGLQRLKRGTQVRALGVTGLPQNEAKMLLDSLGWSS